MARSSVAMKKPVRRSAANANTKTKAGSRGARSSRPVRAQTEHSAKAKHKSAQAQVNARIDADLKATGDAALAAAGLTPTQAVRMLWSLAVRYQGEPEKLREALDPDAAEPTPDELAERQRKVEAVRRGSDLMMELFKERGVELKPDPELQNLSDREYFDLLREEHFREKGYIQ